MLEVFAIALKNNLVTEEYILEEEGQEYLEKVLERVEELKKSF